MAQTFPFLLNLKCCKIVLKHRICSDEAAIKGLKAEFGIEVSDDVRLCYVMIIFVESLQITRDIMPDPN